MLKIIYMIQQTDFDNMENHYPEVHECIGYCDTEEEAWMCIERLDSGKKYKGWDNNYYPKYAVIPLKRLILKSKNRIINNKTEGFKDD